MTHSILDEMPDIDTRLDRLEELVEEAREMMIEVLRTPDDQTITDAEEADRA